MFKKASGEKQPLLWDTSPSSGVVNSVQGGQWGSQYHGYYSIPSGPLGTIPEDGVTPSSSSGNLTESRGFTASLERLQEKPLLKRIRTASPPRRLITVLMSVLTVGGLVANTVVIPLYVQSAMDARSDPYIALILSAMFFPFIMFAQLLLIKVFIDHRVLLVPRSSWLHIFLAGFFQALQALLIAASSSPERTPPYMQPILMTSLIPFTVLARLVIVRKFVNKAQLVCMLVLFIGIFITLEPAIFHVDQAEGSATEPKAAWYYPLLYVFCWLALAISLVIVEMDQTGAEDQFLVYFTWVYVSLYASVLFLFWTDFIPGFGMATSVRDFGDKLRRGYACFFGGDHTCRTMGYTGCIVVFTYSLGNLFANLLIKYSEGALYSVIMQALVTPLATLFWFLFSASPTFHWAPRFNEATVFIIVGLAIIVPSVVLYSYFSDPPEEPSVTIQDTEGHQHPPNGDIIPRIRSAPQLGTITEAS